MVIQVGEAVSAAEAEMAELELIPGRSGIDEETRKAQEQAKDNYAGYGP